MTQFVMQRDRIVPTITGHVVCFKKGEPIHVPPAAHRAVMEAGAVPMEADFAVADEQEKAAVAAEGAERKTKVFEVFATLVARDARGDFDAGGKPSPKVVTQMVGFTIDAKERNALWAEYMEQSE